MLECLLSFSYSNVKRLDHVGFSSKPGIVGLFGRNGSGKSTLLKILGGSLPAQEGFLKIDGHNALGADSYIKSTLRKNFGILFQETSSDDKISALDNLYYACLLMGIDSKKALDLSNEALKLAGLTDRAHEPVKKLSGGMRRRLELYRTFLHRPKILLLDEPTAGLDIKEAKRFNQFLKEYQEAHQALIIISSHNPEELLLCSRILFLAEGKLLADEEPQNLLATLDYLSLSFKLKSEALPPIESLFDIAHDKKNALLTGKIKGDQLEALLQQAWLTNDLKGFTVDVPTLADAYKTLLNEQ